MAKSTKSSVARRGFLKGAAALVTGAPAIRAQQQQTAQRGAATPSAAQVAREAGNIRPALIERVVERP